VSIRAERATHARELHDRGMLRREIAVAMGISPSYAAALLSDPDGSRTRARKDSYGGSCVGCGARTSGSNGRSRAPKRCHRCNTAHREVWTREACIEALLLFYETRGRTPTAGEHGVGPDNRNRVDWLPHMTRLDNVFGSRVAAYEAAGIPAPRGAGERAKS
jgi:hypothetical protein